jgi:hypothetical protein
MDANCMSGNEGKNVNTHNIYHFVVDYDYIIWCHMDAVHCDVTNNSVVWSSCCYVTFLAVSALLLHAIYVMHNLNKAKVPL